MQGESEERGRSKMGLVDGLAWKRSNREKSGESFNAEVAEETR
jgi:hypothetical protein